MAPVNAKPPERRNILFSNRGESSGASKANNGTVITGWQRDLFATILANVDDGVSVQDREMRILYANAAHKRTFGEDIVGRYCYQVYERRPEVCPDCPVAIAFETGKPYRTTHHGFDKNGVALAAEIVATPVLDENGEIVAGIEVVRIVTEEMKAREELLLKSKRLEKLAAVAREISSGLDLRSILRHVVENAAALTGADAGTVALLDEKNKLIRYPFHFNMPEDLANVVVPAGSGVAGNVIAKGKPIILDDYPSEPSRVQAFVDAGVRAILAVPLMIGSKPLGSLGLFGLNAAKQFTQADLEMAMAVADQAAVAIENANLFAKTTEHLRVQQELNNVAMSITSGLDLDHVLSEVVRHAAGMVNAEASMIAMLEEDSERLTYPYTFNMPLELCRVTGRVGTGVSGAVIRDCEARLDNDYAQSDLSLPEFVEAGVTAVATVPLKIGDRCVGAIGVMDKGSGRRFSQDDIDILTIVSRQAAVAVDNARLYQELSRSAQKLEMRVKERTEALSRMYQESERKSGELEAANIKLRELDRLKSEFLANMSHELRTPLNSIIGFSKLILDGIDGEVNEEQQKDLEIVHSNGQDLLRLIDDLLNLARIEAGRANLVQTVAAPDALLSDAVMSMRSAAREKDLKVTESIPEGIEPVPLDAGKVRQVLLNLIGNAIKFTEAGSIDVAIEQTLDNTVFSVRDTGIGIDSESFDAIFDRFHQAAPGVGNSAGVGLGLTISKRFVEMHNGKIWLESDPGGGSAFFFSIPRKPAAGP